MLHYWNMVKRAKGTVVVLADTPERILDRIIFYDENSRPIEKTLNDREKRLYLNQIRQDISYFRRSYQKAHVTVDISGLGRRESAIKVKETLESFFGKAKLA
jgi:hypothetical protein